MQLLDALVRNFANSIFTIMRWTLNFCMCAHVCVHVCVSIFGKQLLPKNMPTHKCCVRERQNFSSSFSLVIAFGCRLPVVGHSCVGHNSNSVLRAASPSPLATARRWHLAFSCGYWMCKNYCKLFRQTSHINGPVEYESREPSRRGHASGHRHKFRGRGNSQLHHGVGADVVSAIGVEIN